MIDMEAIKIKHTYTRRGKEKSFALTFQSPVGTGMGAQSLPKTQSKGSECIEALQKGVAPANNNHQHLPNTDRITISYEKMATNHCEVKRRTGFQSLNHLLAFIIIVCNGDHDGLAV